MTFSQKLDKLVAKTTKTVEFNHLVHGTLFELTVYVCGRKWKSVCWDAGEIPAIPRSAGAKVVLLDVWKED